MKERKRICFVVAIPGTALSFLKEQIKSLSKDFDIYLATNLTGQPDFEIEGLSGVHHIPLKREISVWDDLKTVSKLASYLKEMRFDIVHSVTPKAGLVTALASRFAGIKHRIHIFTGQVWATRKGVLRSLLKTMDKVIATLDNHILVDGESQRRFLISEGVISEKKSKVLGAGSICGANTAKFSPSASEREKQRALLGIPPEKIVFSFMGRLNRDKGIFELFEAFDNLIKSCPNAYLLLFGRDEENCMANIGKYPNIHENVNFKYAGSTSTPELSLQASDVFCLPSYREGFGMSVVEASCLGIPVICSDAYGLAETMVDNITGLRCKVADTQSLEQAMKRLYDDPELRKKLGDNGRKRVLDLFSGEKIISAWVDYYTTLDQA